MADDISKLPPHVRAQIAQAGQAISDNATRVENVQPESGAPTDWQRQAQKPLPEPAHVQAVESKPEQKP